MAFPATKWFLVMITVLSLQVSNSEEADTSTSKPTAKSPTTKKTTKSTITSTPKPTEKPSNGNLTADGSNSGDQNITPSHKNNKGLLKRMLYVAIGFSVIVALYFIVKTIRTKARKSKSKKYGMIYSSGDVEMQPLDKDDDDEDDMTVFDRKTRK